MIKNAKIFSLSQKTQILIQNKMIMNKKLLLLFIAILSFSFGYGQTTIWEEDFESYANGTGITSTGDIGDYPISPAKWTLDVSNGNFSNTSDYLKTTNSFSTQVMTAQDTDGYPNSGTGDVIWLTESIDVSGYTDVELGANFRESGTMEASDFYRIEYNLDGAGWTTFASNGYQNDDYGGWDHASQTGLLGNSLQIRVTLNCNAGGEYQNFDTVKVEGTAVVTTPTITVTPTELSDFRYGFGNGPSNEQAFVVSGTHLTNDISISPDSNWEISLTSDNGGTFSATDPITLTPTAGDVDNTTIYARLKSGLAVNTYAENITASSVGATDVDVAVEGMVYDPCSQLFISEYANAVGGNYIEIYNPTNANVDMADFEIWRAYNGGAWSGADVISLSGVLAGGNVYVVARDQADIPFANKYDSHLNYNGNDNIGLAYDDGSGTAVLIDAVGDDNGDPGTGWDVAGVADATFDHTLVRKSTVDYANTNWSVSAGTDALDSEWVVLDYTTTTQLYHVSNCQLIPLMAVVGHLPGAGNDELVIDEGLAGAQTPKKSNNTLFKNTAIGNTTINAFRIYNTGNTDLQLNGSPIVDLLGADANQFTVSTNPTSPVGANNGYTDFEISFIPTTEGVKTATVSIANNNPFENPYTFTIQGTGYTACSQLFISEYANQVGGNYIEIYNPTNVDVDLSDYEVWRGYNGGAWSGADVIALSGTLFSGDVYIIARDASEIPFADLFDTDMDYNGDDNIGLAYDDGGGTAVLIDAVGDDNGDPGTAWEVAGEANATLNHTLVRKATVDYANTDWDASAGTDAVSSEWIVSDYTQEDSMYHVSDCLAIPIMGLFGNSVFIASGDITPDDVDGTWFGDLMVKDDWTREHEFEIWNVGNTALTLDGSPMVQIVPETTAVGSNPGDFSITVNPVSPVAALGHFTPFSIEFNPTGVGTRWALISIPNDNPFEDPYQFVVAGRGLNYVPCNTTTGIDLASESFEGSGNWSNSISPATYDAASHSDVWAISTTLGTGGDAISNGSDGDNFWGMRDLDNGNGGGDTYHKITFDPIDISTYDNVVLSFDYFSHDYDSGDEIRYLVKYDNDNTWSGEISLSKDTNSWTTVTINVPANSPYVRLKLEAKQNGGSDWAAFDNIKLVGDHTESTTWDGIDWSTPPTADKKAIFDADYQETDASINACACQINDGVTVTVGAGKHLVIESDITVGNGASIIVEHEGSVVQHNANATNTGTGTYTTKKTTTPYHEYDYTYFASPSATATFADAFAASNQSYIWTMTTANMDGVATDGDDWAGVTAANTMDAGVGYAVLGAAADLPFDADTNTWSSNNQDTVSFDGPFNNGDIPVTVVIDGDLADGFNNQNLIGNPYPSAIDMTLFYNANDAVLGPNFHFWTHNSVISTSNSGSYLFNFTNNDYSTWNAGTGAVVGGSATGKTNNFIASAQGFLVEAADLDAGTPSGVVTFTNDMRVTGDNDNFLSPMSTEDEENRLWLNLTNDNEEFRQILVGFFDEATCGFDELYDGPRMPNGASLDFFSVIEGDSRHFAIQGMHTFDDTKIVTLGLEIVDPIAYSIEIDHFEGVFNQGQDIYIYDSYTNTIHDLATGAYHFTSEVGDPINDRLTIRFTDDTTGIDEWTTNANLVVSQDAVNFEIRTSDQTKMNKVVIYNILGQQLDVFTPNTTDLQISKAKYSTGTVLLVKVALENGQVVTQKVITL